MQTRKTRSKSTWLDEDLKRHSLALACQRFAGTHSYDRIAETLEDIHKKTI